MSTGTLTFTDSQGVDHSISFGPGDNPQAWLDKHGDKVTNVRLDREHDNLFAYILDCQTPTDLDVKLDAMDSWVDTQKRISPDGTKVRIDLARERALIRFRKHHGGTDVEVTFCRPEDRDAGSRWIWTSKGKLRNESVQTVEFHGPGAGKSVDMIIVDTDSGPQAILVSLILDIELVK